MKTSTGRSFGQWSYVPVGSLGFCPGAAGAAPSVCKICETVAGKSENGYGGAALLN